MLLYHDEKNRLIDTYCATVKFVGLSEIFPLFV